MVRNAAGAGRLMRVPLAAGALVALASLTPALASHGTERTPGYDISWPQCGGRYPQGPVAFAIIGINGGRPYTPNPCFVEQYRWAQRVERNPAVYVNTDYPKPGRTEANTGPYGTCKADDDWCRAYNYGYGTGREVTERARRLGISPAMWWLDVETGNYWSNDPVYNAQVLRGAIEFFRERNLPLGIYGTPRQWAIIAGRYSPGLPIWNAGAQGYDEAVARCADRSFAFAGGTVRIVQYYDFGFDTNYRCPDRGMAEHYPLPDPFGRDGPPGRSTGPGGAALPHWQALPMVAN